MIRLKFFVFRHQWWILVAATLIAIGLLAAFGQPLSVYLTVLAVLGSISYFLQRQNLEEMALFRDLFKDFNRRYDAMNERLVEIYPESKQPLSPSEKKILVDYLNLCGEEYFYYSRGFIDPRVWEAWRNGMRYYLQNPRIADLWKEERKSDSYYGLEI